MLCADQHTAQLITLYVIDPYRAPFSGLSTNISQDSVIASLTNYFSVQAMGMVTDGSATAIVVYQLGLNKQVTFKATDGLQFETWNPQFLSYPPSYGNCGGNCSMSVNPIRGPDGNYYAFALLLAPKQSMSVDYGPISNQTASITASIATDSGTVTSKPTYLGIGPTPVILVHGIWSNNTAFNTVANDLNNAVPWTSGAFPYPVVSAVCYSKTLAFDAPAGTGGKACDQTAEDALDGNVTSLQHTLTQIQYVGGRVDLVVHSMGGLVARHFTSASRNYTTTSSRMQGLFRTVVTIDTPETGSLLATALMNPSISNGTCNNPQCTGNSPTNAGSVWRKGCGTTPTTTLAQCMASRSEPLGPALASLAPSSANITNLPSINNIQNQNVKWFAIGSDWEDNVGGPKSELRTYFNYLLAAMSISSVPPGFSCNQLPPTLSCILGDNNNDVIVTTTSQFDNTNASQIAEFSNLAHAPMPWGANIRVPALWGTSNNYILDGSADYCVEQILRTSSTSGCPTGSSPQAAVTERETTVAPQSGQELLMYRGETKEDAEERNNYPQTEEPQRMSVKAPEGDAPLGNPVHLTVTLAPGKLSAPLAYVQSSQSKEFDGDLAKVISENGQTKTVEIIPLKLGPVDILVQTVYSDNAIVQQTVHINVVPSANGLTRFVLNQGFSAMGMIINGEEADRQRQLFPMVTYQGVKLPIYLDDSSQIELSAEQDEGESGN